MATLDLSSTVLRAALRAACWLRSATGPASTTNQRDQYLRVLFARPTPLSNAPGRSKALVASGAHPFDPSGTIVEKYLNDRNIDLADDLRGRVLHPFCPWGSGTEPALIAASHPIIEPGDAAVPVAIMRVGLNADGTKIAKKMLGPVAGCAIKFDEDDDVSHGLGIAEGLETSLNVRMSGWRPIWCVGSAGAIASFPPLAGVEGLTVFVDHDVNRVGVAAARTCAERWANAESEAFIRIPRRSGADWADVT